ncbi:hypothetical protein C8F01DRAFT_303615 [Mycena amicta]|nr:hypothetical protein C8F01DRAFT_303615 [Mycena amicta]
MASARSVVDLLDSDAENFVKSRSNHPCQHPDTVRYLRLAAPLNPSPLRYRQRVAAFRFKNERFPICSASDGVLKKYIEPVLEVFHKYVLDDHPSLFKFTYRHEVLPGCGCIVHFECSLTFHAADREIVRIYIDDASGKVLHCLLQFVPLGKICWSSFQIPKIPKSPIICTAASTVLEELDDIFDVERPRFVLISDEEGILVVANVGQRARKRISAFFSYPAEIGQHSLRHTLSLLLFQAPLCKFDAVPWEKDLHGALNCPDKSGDAVVCAGGFRDFDRYTLQRRLRAFHSFLEWKEAESQRLSATPMAPGTTLSLQCNSFIKEEGVSRCPFQNPPIPSETTSFVHRNPRPRFPQVDALLASSQTLNFRITQVVRHEPDTFSQVFFGVLCSPDGDLSPPVCLKLFIDAMFPVDRARLLGDFANEYEPSSWRLQTLHYAEDLVRREEGAYDRLRDYQGTLIPHCYGFHRFTLEGQFSAFGALLEVIPGPSLDEIQPSTWKRGRTGRTGSPSSPMSSRTALCWCRPTRLPWRSDSPARRTRLSTG